MSDSVYTAKFPFRGITKEDSLAVFGGESSDITTPEGTPYFAILKIPRYLYELMGKPEELIVAISKEDFTPRLGKGKVRNEEQKEEATF